MSAEAASLRGWWRRHRDNATSLMAAAPAMLFLGVLTVGFIYEWRKGALEWE